jgi:glucose-6-phosphate isomerase
LIRLDVFVGNHLSSSYTKELLDYLQGKDFSVNVISKSGTTTEPAVAFRLFKQLVELPHHQVQQTSHNPHCLLIV